MLEGIVSEITNVANGINNIRKLVSDTLSGNIKDFNNTLGLLSSVQKEILEILAPKAHRIVFLINEMLI